MEAGLLEIQRSGSPSAKSCGNSALAKGRARTTITIVIYYRQGERAAFRKVKLKCRQSAIRPSPAGARAGACIDAHPIFFSLSSTRLDAPFSPSATSFRPFSIRLSLSLSPRFHLLSGLTGLFLKLGATRTKRPPSYRVPRGCIKLAKRRRAGWIAETAPERCRCLYDVFTMSLRCPKIKPYGFSSIATPPSG